MARSKRLGRLAIDMSLIEDEPEMVLRALKDCIIVATEINYYPEVITYTAICPDFDIVKTGEAIPWYTVNTDGRPPAYTFKRVSS